jgi:autotransporter translocation and assembly factor TamB
MLNTLMRFLAVITGVVVLLFYWLAYTSSGLGFVLNRVAGVSVATVVEGNLSGSAELAEIRINLEGVDVKIERMIIDWQPYRLAGGLLKINELRVFGVEGHSNSSEKAPDVEPGSELPFALELGQLAATDIKWRHAEGLPYKVDKLNLSLSLESSNLNLQKLAVSVNGDEISASGRADISLLDDGVVDMMIGYQVASEPALNPPLSGTLSLTGSWASINIDNKTHAPYATQSLGQVIGIMTDEPAIDLLSSITQVSLTTASAGDLKGEISIRGKLSASVLAANLNYAHLGETHHIELHAGVEGKQILLHSLTVSKLLEAGEPSESLVIKGSVDDYTQPNSSAISLLAQWSNLDFLNSRYQSPLPATQGNLLVEGTADQYVFNLESAFDTQQFSTLNTRVSGAGSLSKIQTESISLDGDGLSLSAQLSTSFDSSQIDVALTDLSGNLRGEKIAGQAEITILSDLIQVNDLVLAIGGAEVNAKGSLGLKAESNLDWSFSAANLNQLDSRLGGSVVGSGKLTGLLDAPTIQSTFVSNELNVDRWHAASVNAELNIGFASASPMLLDISASQVTYDSQEWIDGADLKMTGTLEQHNAELKAVFVDLPESQLSWQGQYQNQVLEFSGNVSNLPAQISRFLTSDLSFQASGLLEGAFNGTYTTAGDSKTDVSLVLQSQITSEQVTLASKAQTASDLVFEQVQIDLNAGNDIELVVSAAFESAGKLDGNVLLQDSILSNSLQTAELAGQFKLNYSNLDSFAAVLPPSMNVDGELTMDAVLAGTLKTPELRLTGVLQDGLLGLKQEGIAISDIRLDVTSLAANRFQLTGSSISGAGSIKLSGEIAIDKSNQLAVDLQLDADNAMFIESPLVKAEGDATIEIKLINRELDVTGSVDIDKADIKIGSSLTAVTESPDLILLGSEPPANALRLKMNLALNLGQNSTFSASGLSGKLVGAPILTLGDLGLLTSVGEIKVVDGKLDILGQRLKIDRGIVSYAGGAVNNPYVVFEATKTIGETRAGIKIEGNVESPDITLFSQPSYEDQDILALMFFDKKLDQLSTSDSLKLISIADSLRGGSFNAKLTAINDEIADLLGVDKFDVSFDSNDDQQKLQVSSRINSKLDIGYAYNFISSLQALFLRYKINDHWSIQSSVDVESGADIKYRIERD